MQTTPMNFKNGLTIAVLLLVILFSLGKINKQLQTFVGGGDNLAQVSKALPTVNVSASPSAIVLGQSSTLTWSSTGASSCTGSASSGWQGESTKNGTKVVTPNVTTTYNIFCVGGEGTTTRSVTVTVSALAFSFSASPNSIVSGQSSTLNWDAPTASSCTASDGWTGSKPKSGTKSFSPTTTTVYTLSCVGEKGSESKSVTVNVTQPPPTVSFSVSPSSIISGSSSTLTWSSTNATSCTASGGWSGPQATLGIKSVVPTTTLTYTLDCTGSGGTDSKSTTVTVTYPAPTLTMTASPTSVTTGQSSTITWSAVNTTSCSASNGWSGTNGVTGSQAVTPSVTTTYTLDCSGLGGVVTKSVTVTVAPPPSTKFKIGDSVQTTSSVNIRSSAGVILGTQTTGTMGTITSGPVVNGNYTRWEVDYVNAPDGWTVQNYLVISTTPPPPPPSNLPTVTMSVSPGYITTGSSATLTWSSTNATSCTASGGWSGTKGTSGTVSVTPTVTTTYALTCTGTGGSVTQSATVSVGVSGPVSQPELPRVYVNTSMPSQTGAVINLANSCTGLSNCYTSFTSAVTAAVPGDTIVVKAGDTFSGNFHLPKKTNPNNKWIVIQSSKLSSLPSSGVRVKPSDAANMPKFVATGPAPAFYADQYSSYYRLVGLEVKDDGKPNNAASILSTTGQRASMSYGLINLGGDNVFNQLAMIPHHIIVDRSYIHGSPTAEIKWGVSLNGANLAVVDSYISEIHVQANTGPFTDTQAISGYNGTGPYKIYNNFLSDAGEGFLLGGADPYIYGVVAKDVEIRKNYFFKPTSWNPTSPKGDYAGVHWSVKNAFEIKAADRVLVEGNIFENNWADAQAGAAIVIKGVNQSGGAATGAYTANITFRYNVLQSSNRAFSLCGECEVPLLPGATKDWTINNNLLLDLDRVKWKGANAVDCCGGVVDGLNKLVNVTFSHNTVQGVVGGNLLSISAGPNAPFFFQDNIASYGPYGIAPDNATAMPGAVITNNVVYTQALSTSLYPGNFAGGSSVSGVGFINPTNDFRTGNYQLSSGSAFKGKASDGKDPGADISTLNSMIYGVVAGTP
ncbi:MAG: hypothetical protein Q8O46_03305 [bacterium]|nr:hypothetical protein [bacterium]